MSVLTGKEKKCYITGQEIDLHKHHIYFGAGQRKISDRNGFWVYLVPNLHNMSKNGVHGKNGHELDLFLKRECQEAYEKKHTREEFMQLIGRNYLEG